MKEQLKKAKAIIEGYDGPAVRVMEVCGTHTHEIFHLGVRKILPRGGTDFWSGCPVCVTIAGFIDEAVWLALEKNVTICTFGDLVRVREVQRVLQMPEVLAARFRWSTLRWMPLNMPKSIKTNRLSFFPLDLRQQLRQVVFL